MKGIRHTCRRKKGTNTCTTERVTRDAFKDEKECNIDEKEAISNPEN